MQRPSLSSIVHGTGHGGFGANEYQNSGTVDFGSGDRDEDEEQSNKKKKSKDKKKTGGFQSFGLSPQVFKGIMKMGFKVPTPIQRKSIPILLSGVDVVGMARTGSGKTAAFLVPMLEKLGERDTKTGVRGLILSPTRELAMQTSLVSSQLGKFTGLRSCLLVGGTSMSAQFEALEDHPDIIIATPGRLMHHLIEMKIPLKQVMYCVFDEADRLFEMGFAAQLHEILKQLGEERQTALFSATLPKQLVEFTRAGLKDPVIIRLDTEAKISPQLRMTFYTLRRDQKSAALLLLLREQIQKDQQTIVFAATRHHVEYLHGLLTACDIPSAPVYGQLDPAARKINLAKFRTKKCSILLVTDVAARGIDIPLLDNVINYDFPSKPKLFIHRSGRVARAGRSGNAFTLVAPDELPYMIDLHLFFGLKLQNDVPAGETYDPQQVYYGNFPRDLLEIEDDSVKTIRNNHGLTRQYEVSERAYAQYNKTREGASTASAVRAKELPPAKIHPSFAMKLGAGEKSVEEFLQGIRGYKSNTTIFEVKQLHIKGGSEAMRLKREMHDLAIEKRTIQQEREREIREKQEAMKVNYGTKKVDKSDLPDFDHAEDDENDDDDEDDDQEAKDDDPDEFDAENHDGSENDEDQDDEEIDDDEEEEDDAQEEDPTPRPSKGTKRKAPEPSTKIRLSKKQRQLQKKRKGADGRAEHGGSEDDDEDRAGPHPDDHSETDDDRSADNNSDDDEQTSRRKARPSSSATTTGLSYRDSKFFISSEPSDEPTERGLSVGESRSTRLEDMVMDLGGDDEQSFAKARAVHTWDARKKRYIRTMVGGDPFKKQRNESGQLIRAKDQPDLYNQWKRTHKKSVGKSSGGADLDDGEGGIDDDSGSGPSSQPDRSDRGRARERRGGGAAGGRGGGRGGKSGASSRASTPSKGSNKKGGVPAKSELRNTDEIRKQRLQKEKNKAKNARGGLRAFRGGRGGGSRGRSSSRGGDGGSFRSSSKDGGEGRGRSSSRGRGGGRGGGSRGGGRSRGGRGRGR